jgi:hypothetical protein
MTITRIYCTFLRCLAYDTCVETFAGADADIVHWEQSYNCFIDMRGDVAFIEQFIRQSMGIPEHPVVVLTSSVTPNWNADKCTDTSPVAKSVEDEESLALVKTGVAGLTRIYTEINKKYFERFTEVHGLVKHYSFAGIQVWDHSHYEIYKCRGPYVADWGKGVRSWHPSERGHRLRAHHHSYVWLAIWRDAIRHLIEVHAKDEPGARLAGIQKHYATYSVPSKLPDRIVHRNYYFTDNQQCFTVFEPHADRSKGLKEIIISGLAPDGSDAKKGWIVDVLDELMDRGMRANHLAQGYLDWKYMLHGNKHSGPLSMSVDVKNEGNIRICQAPGVWGKLPNGYVEIEKSGVRVFLSPNKEDKMNEKYWKKWDYEKDTDQLCIRIQERTTPGHYVLTLLPSDTTDEHVQISIVLIP